ncbi:MAG: DUF2339 domain-containing protein [Filimonas sp.]|nr:DUF2339 domain-containing protein [Filimonas sp.]
MEIFLIFIAIILLFVIISKLPGKNNEVLLNKLYDQVRSLEQEIVRLKKLLENNTAATTTYLEKPPVAEKQQEHKPEPVVTKPPVTEIPKASEQQEILEKPKPASLPPVSADITPKQTTSPKMPEPEESWFNKWLKNNPDIEKFIGENLINKIGIAILVLGIAFFVKYAIDQEWINETGRVCIGFVCGGILVGLAHQLRKQYRSFSSVLLGGGLSVFYFTVAFAFHQYHLFSQSAAFIAMVIITAFGVTFSLLYDRIELAILATIGGFITPFLVSNGDGNYIVLFSYLCILNAGLLVLAYFKQWRTVNYLSFFFTCLIYGGWIVSKAGASSFAYIGTFIFGAIFYALFIAMNVINNVARKTPFKALDFIILLFVNLSFFGAGLFLLQQANAVQAKGLFTASLAVINLVLSYFFFKKTTVDKTFIYLLIGLTLTFISLAAPIQLHGHWITLFWAAEMVVLLWLFQKSKIQLFRYTSLLLTFLTIASLLMDWNNVYGNSLLIPVILNKACITSIVVVAALSITSKLLLNKGEETYIKTLPSRNIGLMYMAVAVILGYITGAIEVVYQFSNRMPDTGMYYIYLSIYTFSFILLVQFFLMTITKVKQGFLLLLFAIGVLLYLAALPATYNILLEILQSGKHRGHFISYIINIVLFGFLLLQNVRIVRKGDFDAGFTTFFTIAFSLFLVIFFSAEIKNLFIWFRFTTAANVENDLQIFIKAGLSILWGLISFAMIWLGMRHKYKPLRVTALVLFGITLFKLFLVDIRDITPAGKIIAFILLGVLLLIISFMYQRLKKLLIDDKTENS